MINRLRDDSRLRLHRKRTAVAAGVEARRKLRTRRDPSAQAPTVWPASSAVSVGFCYAQITATTTDVLTLILHKQGRRARLFA